MPTRSTLALLIVLAGPAAPLLLSAARQAPSSGEDRTPSCPLDRVVAIELGDDDEVLEGGGRYERVPYVAEFSGALYLWTSSGLDLALRVERPGGELVAQNELSTDAPTPFLRLDVEPGAELVLVVAALAPDARGALSLHALAAPETDETRRAAQDASAALAEIDRLKGSGALADARARAERLVDELVATPGGSTSRRIAFALGRAGRAARDLSSVVAADRAWAAGHAMRQRLLPPDHPDLVAAKVLLAGTRYALGDFAGALELEEAIHAARERTLPPEHRDLLVAKSNLALARSALGDLRGALGLQESVRETWTRILPADDPDLLLATQNLAATRLQLGDLTGAHGLFEAVHAARERILPPDHPDLLAAKQNLALTRADLGDLPGAHALNEAVHAARERSLPPDHPKLLLAKTNLATTRSALGDLDGARELLEAVHAASERALPPDHPELLTAKLNLAVLREEIGDEKGAAELFEIVHAARARSLPPDHPDLLMAQFGLARARHAAGDLAAALELHEAVHSARSRLLPDDHPDLLAAKQGLALVRKDVGDAAGALELQEAVYAGKSRLLWPEHPDVSMAAIHLATTRRELGDLDGALPLLERVLAERRRLLPPDHPDVLDAALDLAVTCRLSGDHAGARELFASLLEGVRPRIAALRYEAPRYAREAARELLGKIATVLSFADTADGAPGLEAELFATVESLRWVSVASAETAQSLASRPELERASREVARLRGRLNDLAARGPGEGVGAEEWRRAVFELAEQRDSAERELRQGLARVGSLAGDVDARTIAARLAPGAAAVSFLRYWKWPIVAGERRERPAVDSLLAFVVRRDARVLRVELGSAPELAARVEAWRSALGRPLGARGLGAGAPADDPARAADAGRRLREGVLDPVLAVCGEVDVLHVALDDFLLLVPLDALPLGDGLVGERIAIRSETTLARTLRAGRSAAGTLTLLGGVDYDAEPGGASPPFPAAAVTHRGVAPDRSDIAGDLAPLPGTAHEVASIAALHGEVFGPGAKLFVGAAASRDAFAAAARESRWLHVATHGWFASERVRSQLDAAAERDGRDAWARAEGTLAGFAPETLCGLALSGANRGADALGRVPGILTAEELGAFDLRGCELAVLSACETNVGIRRAGQGIQSLQTALHAAGARTAITSLWKVDDEATRRLFELFYEKLWKQELGKADALWQAKMALRAEGHPPRDWAAWVLSGDPE